MCNSVLTIPCYVNEGCFVRWFLIQPSTFSLPSLVLIPTNSHFSCQSSDSLRILVVSNMAAHYFWYKYCYVQYSIRLPLTKLLLLQMKWLINFGRTVCLNNDSLCCFRLWFLLQADWWETNHSRPPIFHFFPPLICVFD